MDAAQVSAILRTPGTSHTRPSTKAISSGLKAPRRASYLLHTEWFNLHHLGEQAENGLGEVVRPRYLQETRPETRKCRILSWLKEDIVMSAKQTFLKSFFQLVDDGALKAAGGSSGPSCILPYALKFRRYPRSRARTNRRPSLIV